MFRITIGLCVEIHPSARKHGQPDPDIRHAATQFLIAYPLTDTDGPTANSASAPTGPPTCSRPSYHSSTTTPN